MLKSVVSQSGSETCTLLKKLKSKGFVFEKVLVQRLLSRLKDSEREKQDLVLETVEDFSSSVTSS